MMKMKIQIFNRLDKYPIQKQLIEIFLDKILKKYYNNMEGINLIKLIVFQWVVRVKPPLESSGANQPTVKRFISSPFF